MWVDHFGATISNGGEALEGQNAQRSSTNEIPHRSRLTLDGEIDRQVIRQKNTYEAYNQNAGDFQHTDKASNTLNKAIAQ